MKKKNLPFVFKILHSFLLGIAFAAGFSGGITLLAEIPKFYGSDKIDANSLNRMVDGINTLSKQMSGMETREKALEEKVKSLEKWTSDWTGHRPMWEKFGSEINTRQRVVIKEDLYVTGNIYLGSPGSTPRKKL